MSFINIGTIAQGCTLSCRANAAFAVAAIGTAVVVGGTLIAIHKMKTDVEKEKIKSGQTDNQSPTIETATA
ncbi:hypothetical protein ABXV18_27085 [Vibrio owensii]|uniref:hypothetical protein n=1 Tax=Vibrio owensii TaxID=696485 RepID=UPI00339696E0